MKIASYITSVNSMQMRFSYNSIKSISSFVSGLNNSISSLPMREAVRYTNKNMKWTAQHVQTYVDSHANALLASNILPGDTVAVWIKDSAEKHTTTLACLKIGIKVADIDINISNVDDMRECLKLSKCKAIFFEPVSEKQNNLLLLRKSIPELYEYDDTHGQSFHSKHFPNLKYFIQTGFDAEMGCLTYKSLFFRDPPVSEVENLSSSLSDLTPAYFSIKRNAKNISAENEYTHGNLTQHPSLWFAKNLIEKKYFEC